MFTNLRKRAAERRFKDGYSYAAVRLVEGSSTPTGLLMLVDESRDFGSYNTFDKGIEEAIVDFERRLKGSKK